jgi:hypothetical protein
MTVFATDADLSFRQLLTLILNCFQFDHKDIIWR